MFADFLDGARDVVRYFKNERLGFSVTYYEGSRPRQYFPDFIISAREADGREVRWLAETKGEMRLNTSLKSEAARAWCEKMSGSRYGQWRFLFVQQKKLEKSLASGVASLAELTESLVLSPSEPQMKLFAFDDERAKQDAFKSAPSLLPQSRCRLLRSRRGGGARGLDRGRGSRPAL